MQNFILHWRAHNERSQLEKKLSRLAQEQGTRPAHCEASQTTAPHLHAGQFGTLPKRDAKLGLLLLIQKEAKNRNPQKNI